MCRRASAVALVLLACARASLAAPPPDLWLYYPTNLQVDANIDRLETVWRRAATAGYTKVLLADSKFNRLGDPNLPKRYFENVARVRRLASDLKLEIVPAVFPVGYSNDLLYHDPNLAEGLPVRDALLVVDHGKARLQPDPIVSLPAKPSWADDSVRIAGNVAEVHDNPANARFVYKLTVAPFRCYHVSVEVQTDGYTGTPEIKALAAGQSLQYENLGAKKSQPWTRHHVVFDSLDHREVMVYFGVWGKAAGTLRWRDWHIEEAGPVNVLHRRGAPFTIQGRTEGKDYDPVSDPNLGQHPWPGEYDPWHEPPAIKVHNIPDGTRLRASWYFPPIIYDGQVSACLSDPKLMSLLADQATRVKDAFGAASLMMSHDELRCANWDAECEARHESPGRLLADNVRACTKLLAGSHAYVWSDMFDPFHNAHADYYLVRGDLAGSWEGLAPDVTVVNWNFDKRDQSLKFFADRGHHQVIAGYYDSKVENVDAWLTAADHVTGVTGVMYTTWRNNYADLEAFAKRVRGHVDGGAKRTTGDR